MASIKCPGCTRIYDGNKFTNCPSCEAENPQQPKSAKLTGTPYQRIACSVEGCDQNGTFLAPDRQRYCVTHELLRIDRERLQRHNVERPTFAKVPRPPL